MAMTPNGLHALQGQRSWASFAVVIIAFAAGAAAADAAAADAIADVPDQQFAIHGQATYVEQETGSFRAPYAGPNSLSPDQGRETTDATLYLGARPWSGAEFWIAPEVDEGFGLDGTLGLAGFPSAEDYKVGKDAPYLRLPRVFLRQTVNLGPATEAVDADLLQLGGSRSADRWVFTVGKFGVTDAADRTYRRRQREPIDRPRDLATVLGLTDHDELHLTLGPELGHRLEERN